MSKNMIQYDERHVTHISMTISLIHNISKINFTNILKNLQIV